MLITDDFVSSIASTIDATLTASFVLHLCRLVLALRHSLNPRWDHLSARDRVSRDVDRLHVPLAVDPFCVSTPKTAVELERPTAKEDCVKRQVVDFSHLDQLDSSSLSLPHAPSISSFHS